MEKELREKFESMNLNAQPGYGTTTELMFAAYNLAKQEECKRCANIAHQYKQSYINKGKYLAPQSIMKIANDEAADAARNISNSIIGKNALNAHLSDDEIIQKRLNPLLDGL